jgi:hypothetical protein
MEDVMNTPYKPSPELDKEARRLVGPLWDVPLSPLEVERIENGQINPVTGMAQLTLAECRADDAERRARGETHDRYGNRYITEAEAKDFFGE